MPVPVLTNAFLEGFLQHELRMMCEFLARHPDFTVGSWRPALYWDRRRCVSSGGLRGLRLHIAEELGGRGFHEYRSFAASTRIGTVEHPGAGLALRILLTHELAHAVQFDRKVKHHALTRKDLKAPHGVGWKHIYGLLRDRFVNGNRLWLHDPLVMFKKEDQPLPAGLAWSPCNDGRNHIHVADPQGVPISARKHKPSGERLCGKPRSGVRRMHARNCPACVLAASHYHSWTVVKPSRNMPYQKAA